MKTVNEVSRLAGVSIRTLHHYHSIGLLPPAGVSEAGYRLYDDHALKRLQQILLFREMDFPLAQIKQILDSPHFDGEEALSQQIALLSLKKERLEKMIDLARTLQQKGSNTMDFSAFDNQQIEDYQQQAKEKWGHTDSYRQSVEKGRHRTKEDWQRIQQDMMALFVTFGGIKTKPPGSEEAQAQVRALQTYITEHFYDCTPPILLSLGRMYTEDAAFTANIDGAGGEGTAAFVRQAIERYVGEVV